MNIDHSLYFKIPAFKISSQECLLKISLADVICFTLSVICAVQHISSHTAVSYMLCYKPPVKMKPSIDSPSEQYFLLLTE